ncbi:MAG: ABC transporter permease [Caldilineaceae bacterium]|nr:ABC transporter permease [Caldilineaceae bacterium]MCB9139013.1 ABC transporter permease [Caldilineaceae bacterium]
MSLKTLWILAEKELEDALRNRWFILYTLAFMALSLALSYLALAGAGMVGFAGFGRTAASLINLVLLIVPLMALTIGAQSIAGEEEQGTLTYLMAQPISRTELFWGKFLGLALGLLAALLLGFGVAGLVMATQSASAADPEVYIRLVVLAYLLSLTMLSVGMLVSAFTNRTGVAIGVGLFLWLIFVFFGDLGLMGTAIALRVPIDNLFYLSLINPLQVFKMAAILDINTSLDILGPAGVFALQEYGDQLFSLFMGVLALWIIVPATAAYWRLNTKANL